MPSHLLRVTRLDYKEGGSFNYLGLDVGKHYIDHCLHLFEKHCAYISTIRHTYKALFDAQQGNKNLNFKKISTTRILGKVLRGQPPEEIQKFQSTTYDKEKVIAIESFVHQHFFKAYASAELIVNAFKLDTINRIVKEPLFGQ